MAGPSQRKGNENEQNQIGTGQILRDSSRFWDRWLWERYPNLAYEEFVQLVGWVSD